MSASCPSDGTNGMQISPFSIFSFIELYYEQYLWQLYCHNNFNGPSILICSSNCRTFSHNISQTPRAITLNSASALLAITPCFLLLPVTKLPHTNMQYLEVDLRSCSTQHNQHLYTLPHLYHHTSQKKNLNHDFPSSNEVFEVLH